MKCSEYRDGAGQAFPQDCLKPLYMAGYGPETTASYINRLLKRIAWTSRAILLLATVSPVIILVASGLLPSPEHWAGVVLAGAATVLGIMMLLQGLQARWMCRVLNPRELLAGLAKGKRSSEVGKAGNLK